MITFEPKSTAEKETLDSDKSVHELLRKAVRCCDNEDTIALSLESAMGIVLEWDELKSKIR